MVKTTKTASPRTVHDASCRLLFARGDFATVQLQYSLLETQQTLPMTLVVLAEGGKVGRAQLIIDDSHSFLPRHSQVSHFCDKFMGLLF